MRTSTVLDVHVAHRKALKTLVSRPKSNQIPELRITSTAVVFLLSSKSLFLVLFGVLGV